MFRHFYPNIFLIVVIMTTTTKNINIIIIITIRRPNNYKGWLNNFIEFSLSRIF